MMESTTRFPQSLEIAARFPHSQQADDEADANVENQKQVYHRSTAEILAYQHSFNPLTLVP